MGTIEISCETSIDEKQNQIRYL